MFHKPTSLIEFILEEEQKIPDATGSLTLLLTQLEYAGKIIASHIKQAGLVDILGETGEKNVSEDNVKKIDVFSNELLTKTLHDSGQVAAVASEEMEDPLWINKNGNYIVFFDPLDGSSNVDTNAPCGTIFSIYKNRGELLQKGSEQIAAGYILYGTSVMFVYSVGNGVNGFTLDPSIGSFLLSHPSLTFPDSPSYYSVNEHQASTWPHPVQTFFTSVKATKGIKPRYIGAMVADMHRILLKGGVFLYPQDINNPEGKLRLMYEVNPFSYLIKQAGGISLTTTGKDPLSISPASLHQRTPFLTGSPTLLSTYPSYL